MLQIQDKLISLDIIEKKFKCNLEKCKGACCLHGDSGAPLEEVEKKILNKIFPKIKSYLSKENLKTLKKEGLYYKDKEGDWVTTLHNGKQCAFSVIENDIYFCSIEKAFFDKKIDFRKPVSCHLYPVRIKKYDTFEAINYDDWVICDPAKTEGNNENIRLYEFIKEALVRKYGNSWYDEFHKASVEYLKQHS
ncbi:DUF3109 family protein [Bacteroidota bacterium]